MCVCVCVCVLRAPVTELYSIGSLYHVLHDKTISITYDRLLRVRVMMLIAQCMLIDRQGFSTQLVCSCCWFFFFFYFIVLWLCHNYSRYVKN